MKRGTPLAIAVCATAVCASFVLARAEPSTPPENGTVHVEFPKAVDPAIGYVKLTTNVARYSGAAPVEFTFTVTNPNKSQLSYSFSDSQQFDITVSTADGKPVWHWSKGRKFGQMVSKLVLAPGQAREYKAQWTQLDDNGSRVPPGEYVAAATLTPMPRFIVSGGILIDPDTDPNNMGVPTKSDIESGATLQHDATPEITAKDSFAIGP